ncbi:MAG: dephospho-CoA kinase [Acidobacteria bacterium]|nr:dephospho-CoA kinase [Acidobacteriota bacterium]
MNDSVMKSDVNFLLVGLTGSIGSGKSEVRKTLEQLGCVTIDADKVSRDLTKIGSPILAEIVDEWGYGILTGDGRLDRRKLSEIVFRDRPATEKLEAILHPAVIAEENRIIEQIKAHSNGGIIVVEASLMLETGSAERFDKIIVVTRDKDKRFELVSKNRGISRELFDLVERRQMPQDEKLKSAVYHIENDEGLEELAEKVLWLNGRLQEDLKMKKDKTENKPKNKTVKNGGLFEASVTLRFSAAHYLREYPGNCANLHGHNWTVTVTVRASQLDELGFVIDFRTLKKHTKGIIDELDHSLINDHKDFKETNPSSENIALWIFDRLKPMIDDERCKLHCVEVGETENSSIRYYG